MASYSVAAKRRRQNKARARKVTGRGIRFRGGKNDPTEPPGKDIKYRGNTKKASGFETISDAEEGGVKSSGGEQTAKVTGTNKKARRSDKYAPKPKSKGNVASERSAKAKTTQSGMDFDAVALLRALSDPLLAFGGGVNDLIQNPGAAARAVSDVPLGIGGGVNQALQGLNTGQGPMAQMPGPMTQPNSGYLGQGLDALGGMLPGMGAGVGAGNPGNPGNPGQPGLPLGPQMGAPPPGGMPPMPQGPPPQQGLMGGTPGTLESLLMQILGGGGR